MGGVAAVLLARARDGELRGFVNVCRHRGHVLCDGDMRRELIRCPYHAWTYGLDGALRHAPRADREPGLDREALGLVPVAVDAFGPFVFVNPDAGSAPLADALGDLPALLASGGVDVDSLRFHARRSRTNTPATGRSASRTSRGYHCAVAHPGLAKVLDVSPDAYELAAKRLLASQFAPPRGDGVSSEAEVAQGQFHLLFPATVVNVMPGQPNLSIGPIVPRGPETTYRFLDYFVGPDVDDAWLVDQLALDEQVGAEDRALVEGVQRGVASGGLEAGTLLAEPEQLIAWFQSLVAEALGSDVAGD